MAIDDSTPITARAYDAINEAATAKDGTHQRVAITSLLGAVHALEARQNAILDALKRTLSAVETTVQATKSHANVSQKHNEALDSLQKAVQALADESRPAAPKD